VTGTSSSSITVSWSPVPGANNYVVTWGITAATSNGYWNWDGNGTSVICTGLQAGTTYYFRVYSALDSYTSGSTLVSATTWP
jgi:hypothetical protein